MSPFIDEYTCTMYIDLDRDINYSMDCTSVLNYSCTVYNVHCVYVGSPCNLYCIVVISISNCP